MDGYGGVMIAIKSDLVHQEIKLNTTCDMVAAKIFLIGNQPPLIAVAAYRPTNRDIGYQEQLCSTLESLTKDNPRSPIWIGDDFNLPDTDWASESITNTAYPFAISDTFLDMTHTVGLKQTVDFPTRQDNTLDLFLTNRPSLVTRCEPLPGLSDHEIVYTESTAAAKRRKPVEREINLWNKTDFDKVREAATSLTADFFAAYNINTPIDTMWSAIKEKLLKLLEDFVPKKLSSTRFSQPWITREVKRLVARKKRWYRIARKSIIHSSFSEIQGTE